MKHKRRGVELNAKDFLLFRYLHAVKIATYDQIARDIYTDYSLASVGNRIRKLEDNRLIATSSYRLLLHGKRTVCLAKHTFERFVKKGTEYQVELKSDAVHHDLALVDIRSQFLKSKKLAMYQTENEIQTWGGPCRNLNYDALFTAKLGSDAHHLAVEYEGSMKKEDRYEPFLRKYYNNYEIVLVLFVAETSSIVEKVMKLEKELFDSEKPKFCYRVLQDFLQDDALRFENFNQRTLQFG